MGNNGKRDGGGGGRTRRQNPISTCRLSSVVARRVSRKHVIPARKSVSISHDAKLMWRLLSGNSLTRTAAQRRADVTTNIIRSSSSATAAHVVLFIRRAVFFHARNNRGRAEKGDGTVVVFEPRVVRAPVFCLLSRKI